MLRNSALTVFKINASNDEIVDIVREHFKMYQVEHTPESFYTEKKRQKKVNYLEVFRDAYIFLFNLKFLRPTFS